MNFLRRLKKAGCRLDLNDLEQKIIEASKQIKCLKEEVSKIIVGQQEMIESLLIAFLADGHLLLEGVPGLAKTMTVTTFAKAIDTDFKRIQFTPDLLPADLIGTSIYNQREATFSISKGPIFTNILIADEINRAPAKVQSALLEVMQERQVTISGQTFEIGNPFLVLATQNPIEQEGTYPLPEAQTDRFMMKVKIDYPSKEEEKVIVANRGNIGETTIVKEVIQTEELLKFRKLVNEVYIDDKIIDYILNIVFASRYPKEYGVPIEGLLMFGASPRASIALKKASKAHAFLKGRAYVTPHDIKQIAHDVLRHRLRRSYEAEADNVSSDEIIDQILSKLAIP